MFCGEDEPCLIGDHLSTSVSPFLFPFERVGDARARVQGTPPRRGKSGLGRMVGVGQIPGSEVVNTEEVEGMVAYTYTTTRELKVEEIASSADAGGAKPCYGGVTRRKRWDG